MRDIVNVDKQDDGATYRVFHSDILAQIYQTSLENNEMQSLFAYLFVLGINSKYLLYYLLYILCL